MVNYFPVYPKPQRSLENDRGKLVWYHSIVTHHNVNHNRSDLVLNLKGERACFLIDVVVPLDRNIAEKHEEKIRKLGPLVERSEADMETAKYLSNIKPY